VSWSELLLDEPCNVTYLLLIMMTCTYSNWWEGMGAPSLTSCSMSWECVSKWPMQKHWSVTHKLLFADEICRMIWASNKLLLTSCYYMIRFLENKCSYDAHNLWIMGRDMIWLNKWKMLPWCCSPTVDHMLRVIIWDSWQKSLQYHLTICLYGARCGQSVW